ncbi:tRNA (N(6)-L-threonylcarbamoyladenosine(37)-C(2))-methylthiotransferase MtaB [bacterium]|nr:tRNA (N(6)-L-threonylcarbamoyladenosine(37)-C(2))-methylthiotransferase MtaB [bacterium]
MMNNKKTFYIYTLGCKVNQYESQLMRERLQQIGFTETTGDKAAYCIINTCTVTAQSDNKSKRAVRKIISTNANTRIIITGCGGERMKTKFADSNEVIFICANDAKNRLAGLIQSIDRDFSSLPPNKSAVNDIFSSCTEQHCHITSFAKHTRAFVKVQDGCDSSCAYCIIPLVRGASKSRDLNDITAELTELVSNGFKEIVLTGIHIGQYIDSAGNTLCDLLKSACSVSGLARLRISSIEPQDITDEFIDIFSKNNIIAPYLHISLQHGDNRILKKMNRQYTIEYYMDLIKKIRSRKKNCLFTTDLIVGFPGETDEMFYSSLDKVIELGFLKVHVFPFSSRPGTAAEKMKDKVIKKIAKERAKEAAQKSIERADSIKASFIGTACEVLVESTKDKQTKMSVGITANYLKVLFNCEKDCANELKKVNITGLINGNLSGDLIDETCVQLG